jgi:protein-S-isoprenylcysteine O-methyltransferase Ste14
VDTGIYRVIRHPLYLGLALLYAGLALFAGARLSWLVVALGWAGIGVRNIAEERWLSAHLPGYQAYMQRTKRLIPGVW